ncbi:MAG: response regulator [Proteobacteria bacterium]|nr:response regulator [Pseudomonadota bacterium]
MPEATATRPRILFVEDEVTVRDHLARKLSDEYVVDTADNGNEALLAVIRAKPALVVSDIVMPDMDGVELLKTLRDSPGTRAIPVLLISGRAADEYRIEGFDKGADGFLAKPYTERELRALIGSMLRAAKLRADTAGREARDRAEQSALTERVTLFEKMTGGFYTLDRQWRLTYVNQHALEFFGTPQADLVGSNFWELYPETRGSLLEAQFRRAVQEPCSVWFEMLALPVNRWIEVHANPTTRGLAVNFRDLHERKAREIQLLAELTREARNPQLAPERLQQLIEDLQRTLLPER